MSSYVAENRVVLSKWHYIRKATTQDYWHDFSANQVEHYRSLYGESFCMVVYGSEVEEDAYVMPYRRVKSFYDPIYLYDERRWIGTIVDDVLSLRRSNRSISVSAFYNALDLLDDEPTEAAEIDGTDIILDNDTEISLQNIRHRISDFNRRYRAAVPYKRRVISEQVARPGAVTDYLKKLHNYNCQLCDAQGFKKRNGSRYAETHHLTELHQLIPGSYCSDNIIVVCPTCHKKLHYAAATYSLVKDSQVAAIINGERCTFKRNMIS